MIPLTARYTEVLYNLLNNPQSKKAIDDAMSEYPVYEPENPITYTLMPTREELNKRILDYYKYREIGFETVGRFIDELRISLNEIMPYYYQLFKSQDVMNGVEDVFGNVDIVESFSELSSDNTSNSSNASSEATSSATSNTSATNYSKDVKSLTPQNQLSITNKNIDSVDYADEVNWNKVDSTSNGSDTATSNTTSNTTGENSRTGTIEHTLTRKGNQGVNTYAHDMKELRTSFLNIIDDIINHPRISELFLLIY